VTAKLVNSMMTKVSAALSVSSTAELAPHKWLKTATILPIIPPKTNEYHE
jgi:hypothetical protein